MMTQASRPLIYAADDAGIRRAAEYLRDGGIVAVPTETVYGLAARADRDESVAAIYRAKGRPSFNPLIVHVADVAQARCIAVLDDRAKALVAAFWPGPLTLVLPLREDSGLAPAVTAGLPSVAVRCPAHPVMRRVLEQARVPLAAPSANRSGGVSPTCVKHVVQSLGSAVGMVLDGGPSSQGVESTIVVLREDTWQILRPGPIASDALERILGAPGAEHGSTQIEAPGQLASHYAPGKPMRLNAVSPAPDEYFIGFGALGGDAQLSDAGDLAWAASRLYTMLHLAAASSQPRIAVAPIPEEGIGIAINDRLRRAAA